MDKTILNNKIQELYDTTPDYVHSVGYGYKTINGIITNEKSIIFSVIEKKPIDQIPSDEILPSIVNINGNAIKTDVVQSEQARTTASYRSNCRSVSDSSSDPNRIKHRPLVGGISMFRDGGGVNAGTLGLIVKDKEDDTILGLTNNHVIIGYPFIASEWDPNGAMLNNCALSAMQPANLDGGSVTTDKIGHIKRYDPISETTTNFTDSALFAANDLDFSSIKILGLDNTTYIPFATKLEIDNLLENANDLFKSARSTGATGFPTCPMVVFEESVSSTVGSYNKQGLAVNVPYSDLLKIRYKTPPQIYVSYGGDSGAAVVAKIGGIDKIIGLLFAGPSDNSFFLACRIDRIASALNIEAWDPSITPLKYSYISNWTFIAKSGLLPDKIIFENGKKYWQVGVQKNGSVTQTIYVTYSTLSTTTPSPGTTTTSSPGTTTPTPTTPAPTPGNCDTEIDCAFVFDKTDNSISIYLVYKEDYSYTDTYLELAFYDATGAIIQQYSPFKKISDLYDIIKLMSTDPYLTININDICAVSARLYQPTPCLPASDSDGSGSDCDCIEETVTFTTVTGQPGRTCSPETKETKYLTLPSCIDLPVNATVTWEADDGIAIDGVRLNDPCPSGNSGQQNIVLHNRNVEISLIDDFGISWSGTVSLRIGNNCECDEKTTFGNMTGYRVEAIYVDSSDNSPCIPEQPAASSASSLLPIITLEKDDRSHIQGAGEVVGCGVSVKSPCGGGHLCNRAQFDITLSANSNPDLVVLEANLNNSGPVDGFGNSNPDNGPSSLFGGTWDPLPDGIGLNINDRYSTSIITKSQNDAIFAGLPPSTGPGDPAYSVTVKIIANSVNTNPHSDITWVRIKDTCGRIVYSCCIGEGILDPDPCCELGGGPNFPPCPNWDGPPVPGCLPPTTTTTTTTSTTTSTTPEPSGSGSTMALTINNLTIDQLKNILKNNNINLHNNILYFNNTNKNDINQIFLDNNIHINYVSYQFDTKSQSWIRVNDIPNNFIINCTDGNIIFQNIDGDDNVGI
jgi:hypothetical protein